MASRVSFGWPMRLILFLAVLLVIPSPGSTPPLTLRDTIQLAMRQSPDLLAESHRVEIAGLEHENARAKLLPSLDIEGTHGLLKASPTTTTDPWSSQIKLGVTETLYDNGQTLIGIKAAKLNRDFAELSYAQARERHTLAIASVFFKFSLQAKLKAARAEQQKLVQEQHKNVLDYFRQGLKTEKEVSRLQAQADRADLQLIEAENALEKTRAELSRLIGQSALELSQVNFRPAEETELPNSISAGSPDITQMPTYRLAQLVSEISAQEITRARLNYYPRVDLNATLSYGNADYLGSSQAFGANEQIQASVLLTLKYNFWDWGIRSRDISIATRKLNIKELEFDSTRLRLQAEAQGLMLDLNRIKATLDQTKKLEQLEEKNYRSLRLDFREGKVNTFDLLQGLENLLDARTRYYSVHFELAEAMARYHFYQGNAYEKLTLN